MQMVAQEPAIRERLSGGELDACFEYDRHLRYVERAYQQLRVEQNCDEIAGWPTYDGRADYPSEPASVQLEELE